jgi:hypothetical protein
MKRRISKMKPNTLGIIGLVFSGIACVASVAQSIDAIKNGDKRSAIAGDAAGRAAVDETEKRSQRTIFGTIRES